MMSSSVICFKNKERNPKEFGRLLQSPVTMMGIILVHFTALLA